ncbi:hypothetical protein HA466_0102030 [Hirschfeldia incana]|nr:hypothetical protein HA466_0102030 [Hirschfeldia incana]
MSRRSKPTQLRKWLLPPVVRQSSPHCSFLCQHHHGFLSVAVRKPQIQYDNPQLYLPFISENSNSFKDPPKTSSTSLWLSHSASDELLCTLFRLSL